MRVPTIFALALVASCTSIADVRDSEAFLTLQSDRTAQAVIACVADQWSERAAEVNIVPRPDGGSASLAYQGAISGPIVEAVVDVVDDAHGSNITVYAAPGNRSDRLRNEVSSCI